MDDIDFLKLIQGSNQELRFKVFKSLISSPDVIKDFAEWFDNNLIYSENTESFVLRLSKFIKDNPKTNKVSLQNRAFEIIDEMRLEYVLINYQGDYLKEIVNKQIKELREIDELISKECQRRGIK